MTIQAKLVFSDGRVLRCGDRFRSDTVRSFVATDAGGFFINDQPATYWTGGDQPIQAGLTWPDGREVNLGDKVRHISTNTIVRVYRLAADGRGVYINEELADKYEPEPRLVVHVRDADDQLVETITDTRDNVMARLTAVVRPGIVVEFEPEPEPEFRHYQVTITCEVFAGAPEDALDAALGGGAYYTVHDGAVLVLEGTT